MSTITSYLVALSGQIDVVDNPTKFSLPVAKGVFIPFEAKLYYRHGPVDMADEQFRPLGVITST